MPQLLEMACDRPGDSKINAGFPDRSSSVLGSGPFKRILAANGNPEVLRCRDLELSERHGAIYAHVVAEMAPGTSLDTAHAVETQLEELLRGEVPDLEDVVARVTA